MIVVAIVGILAVLAIYGVRKYIANAKTAEARNSLGQIGKDSATAYEKETMAATVLGEGSSTAVGRAICTTAAPNVPSAIGAVQGKKYQSSQAPGSDWQAQNSSNGGFACLKFAMQAPQYYMYSFTNVGATAYTAMANGDLNGDGIQSSFQLFGSIDSNNQLISSPNIQETNPEE
jgi:type IV pilus assembly protein PilA